MTPNAFAIILVLSVTTWSATEATADACAGISAFPDFIDDWAAGSQTCTVVDAMKGVDAAARCAALSPFGFGTASRLFSTETNCAVGIETGGVLASQLSASATHQHCSDKEKWRLNAKQEPNGGDGWAGAWCGGSKFGGDYVEITLLEPTIVTGVITQGRDNTWIASKQWVETFQIMYLPREGAEEMEYIRDENGDIKEFQGNSDSGTQVKNIFPEAITTTTIRIKPTSFRSYPSMRFELLKACPGGPGNVLCSIIDDVLAIGLPIPDDLCTRIFGEIVDPVMKDEIDTDDIADTVRPKLEEIVQTVIDTSSAAVDQFSSFIESFNVCLPVNVNPNYWKARVEKIIEFIKTLRQGKDHGEEMLQSLQYLAEDCRTYSLIFTLDIEALAIFGKETGLYFTFDVDGGFTVTESGIVNGVSVNYGLDKDLDLSAGVTVAFVFGAMTSESWGYAVELGASIPVYGVGIGLSGGLLFSADPVTKALGNFNGVTMSLSGSFGESSLTVDFDASISCAFSTARSFTDSFNQENAECVAAQGGQNFDEMIAPLQESLDNAWAAIESKWDELKRCGNLYACEAKRCVYNFTPDNYRECTDMANQCSDEMDECLTWEHQCEQRTYVQEAAGCLEHTCRTVTEKVACKEYACENVQEKAGCKQRECRLVSSQSCENEKVICGFLDLFCTGFKWVCKTVTEEVCDGPCVEWHYTVKEVCSDVCQKWEEKVYQVCDGVCKLWEYITVEIIDPIISKVECVALGMVEIAKNFRCFEYVPNCLHSGHCYVSKATAAPVQCTTGMLAPSEECLEEQGFI